MLYVMYIFDECSYDIGIKRYVIDKDLCCVCM